MNKLNALAITLLCLLSAQAYATHLTAQLNQFFKTLNGQKSDAITVVVKSPKAQWPRCDNPRFTLPGNARQWGIMSVAANCDDVRRYIQVQVQVTGEYVVAAHRVSRGATVTLQDLKIVKGRLDTLPARTVVEPDEIVDAVALRDIIPGHPVNQMMVRQPWRIKAGQKVRVTASGEGFAVSSEGRAMNNATSTQSVRVRMNSGQIVSGKVDADGKVLISL